MEERRRCGGAQQPRAEQCTIGAGEVLGARHGGDSHLDQGIPGPQALQDTPLQVLLCTDEPVAVAAVPGEGDENPRDKEEVLHDGKRVVGNGGLQLGDVGHLAGLVVAEGDGGQQMGARRQERLLN